MYPAEGSYPFGTIPVGDNTVTALTTLLPPDDEIFHHLDLFEKRGQSCSFPHVLDEMTKREVERFLEDRETNATKSPEMLGLIFATLAVGLQIGVFDQSSGQWLEASMASSHRRGEVYRRSHR